MTIARLAAVLVISAAAPAHAQSAEAEVLFREAKKLLRDGRTAEACDKFDASERLEPSVGTLLNLADCRERNHQLATAWAVFHKAAVAAKSARDGKREREARRREKLLGTRLSYLSVNVAAPGAGEIHGLAITRNGAELDPALWNQSMPIDAGDYELAAAADGYQLWTGLVRVDREGQRAEIDIPALAPRPAPPPRAAEHAPPAAAEAEPADGEETRRAPASSRVTATRGVAIGVAVVGAAGLTAGILYGLRGRDLERQSDAVCPVATCNDSRALSLNADARRDGKIANLGFIAGGGLVAAAVALWFVGGPHVAPVVARDRVGIALGGSL